MKMRIYKEKKEKELCFTLQEEHDGITLNTVDENGMLMYTILTITNDGYLQLHKNIHDYLGLRTDEEGKIIIKEN